MTTFKFRLERVLNWRQTRLEMEQFTLTRLAAECARWDRVLVELENSRAHAESLVSSSASLHGRDLQAMVRYKELVAKQKQIALNRRREVERKMEKQRERVLQ